MLKGLGNLGDMAGMMKKMKKMGMGGMMKAMKGLMGGKMDELEMLAGKMDPDGMGKDMEELKKKVESGELGTNPLAGGGAIPSRRCSARWRHRPPRRRVGIRRVPAHRPCV